MTDAPAGYREALISARFPVERVRILSRIRPWRMLCDLGAAAGSLGVVPLLYGLFPHPLMFLVCAMLSIRTFNCFAQLVHTSDHGGLLPSPALNRIVGNLCAYCLGYTRSGHRLTHLSHHLYLNTEKDPDRIWGAPDQTMRELSWMWMRDFFFVSALERLVQYWRSDRRSASAGSRRPLTPALFARGALAMSPVLIAQCMIFTIYALLAGPMSYVLLYVLPIMTLYPAQIRLRSTVEHSFSVGYQPRVPHDFWVTRSTRGYALERFVFSPFGIHYHFEHHLFPGVPHYNLARVRQLLQEYGFPVPLASGYVAFVLRKLQAEKLALARTA